jgi:acyl-CoA thioesterase
MSLNEFEIVKRLGNDIFNLLITLFNFINIGEGAYSSVYHVKRYSDGETYALKKVKM